MASQDNENAMDGLLRRSLARDSAAAGDCPDAGLLAAYFDQALGADEAAGYELHFSTCTRCREQLAAMARASTGQIVQPDLALEPALAGARPVPAIAIGAGRTPAQAKPAVSIARSETNLPERKSPDARWLDLRWLIPVAAMLVLGTFVFMRFASRETSIGPNQVAMSKSTPAPQDQTAPEPEKKASDAATTEKAAPKTLPSATSTPSRSSSSATARNVQSSSNRTEANAKTSFVSRRLRVISNATALRVPHMRLKPHFLRAKQSAGAISGPMVDGLPEIPIRARSRRTGSGVECVNGENSSRHGFRRRREISRTHAASSCRTKSQAFGLAGRRISIAQRQKNLSQKQNKPRRATRKQ